MYFPFFPFFFFSCIDMHFYKKRKGEKGRGTEQKYFIILGVFAIWVFCEVIFL